MLARGSRRVIISGNNRFYTLFSGMSGMFKPLGYSSREGTVRDRNNHNSLINHRYSPLFMDLNLDTGPPDPNIPD